MPDDSVVYTVGELARSWKVCTRTVYNMIASGIPTTTMRRYCLGELRPSVSAMEKLAEIGLTEEYVYGRRATAELASSVANDKFIRRFLAQPASVQAEIRDLFEVLFV